MSGKIYILDFQGFKNNNNDFIIKEIAVTTTESNGFLRHWFVKPPYGIDRLSPDFKRQAYYNAKFYHGIPWNYGNTPFNYVKKELKNILPHNTVYVKGREKQLFIQQLIKRATVIDLDDIPSLKKLQSRNNCCGFHLNNSILCCAVANVFKIQTYVQLTGY